MISRSTMAGAIFDMDGTILDSADIWEDTLYRILLELGYAPKPTLKDDVFPLSGAESSLFLKKDYNMRESEEEIAALLDQYISDYYFHHAALKPGAAEYLRNLHRRNIPMALVTATERRYLEPALASNGILPLFKAILPCGEYNTSKYHPEIFLEAAAQLGTDPSATWVFEDAPHALQTANTAGFPTCAVSDLVNEQNWIIARSIADLSLEHFSDWQRVLPF